MRLSFIQNLLVVSVMCAHAPSVGAQARSDLAAVGQTATAILTRRCGSCHSDDGNDMAGMGAMVNRQSLVSHGIAVPGSAERSSLYARLVTTNRRERMPRDEDSLPASEIDSIRRWVELGLPDAAGVVAGAAPSTRAIVSETDLLAVMVADLQSINSSLRRFVRYVSVAHLNNEPSITTEQLRQVRDAAEFAINSLSNDSAVHSLVATASPVLFRVDLRDFDWDAGRWQELIAANPYTFSVSGAHAAQLARELDTVQPYVRADWFVTAALRPPLYHTLLRIPSTVDELERRLGVDVARNVATFRAVRAGFTDSAISINNRLLERHPSPQGGYWRSYDFVDSVGRHDLFQNPLGSQPTSNSPFEANGGEIIFSLPNRLQGYMLIGGRGERIEAAPTSIVRATGQRDQTVVNGISCITCHSRVGLHNKSDRILESVRAATHFSSNVVERVTLLYDERRFQAALREDTAAYLEATSRIRANADFGQAVQVVSDRYSERLSVDRVAAEFGLDASTLQARIRAAVPSSSVARVLARLLVANGQIQRDSFVCEFGGLVRELIASVSFTPLSRSTQCSATSMSAAATALQPSTPLGGGAGPQIVVGILPQVAHRRFAACEAHDGLACLDVGRAVATGAPGLPQNTERAAAFFREACTQRVTDGCVALALLLREGHATAQSRESVGDLLAAACDRGANHACFELGVALRRGAGVRQNLQSAASIFDAACRRNHLRSCIEIGRMTQAGEGVPANPARALQWFRYACSRGDLQGCTFAGSMDTRPQRY